MLDHMLTRIENAQADGATYLALYSPAGVQIDSLELQDISAINDDLGGLRAEIAALRAHLEAVRAALPILERVAEGGDPYDPTPWVEREARAKEAQAALPALRAALESEAKP